MKTIIPAVFLFFLFVIGCTPGSNEKYDYFSQTNKATKSDSSGLLLASPIIYEILVKNPDLEDTWTSEKLKTFRKDEFVNIIFEAVYSGKIKAYNYHTGAEITVRDIKKLEDSEDFDRSMIGKIQFEEDWYFDKESFLLTRNIRSIMLAYEVIDQFGNVQSYKAAFLITLNEIQKLSPHTK